MLAASAQISTVWVSAIAILLGGAGLGVLTFVANTLLKHAQILAVVTTELKEIPTLAASIAVVDSKVQAINAEQVRVATELAIRFPRTAATVTVAPPP